MTTPNQIQPLDVTAAPRALLRESVRLLYRLFGERRLGTAQGNAWAAVCADRERAKQRAQMVVLLAAARSGSASGERSEPARGRGSYGALRRA